MKNFRIVCLIVCVVLIGFHLFSLDFQDLRFSKNKAHYLGILAMVLVGLSFVLGIIKDRKKDN
ncbi:hypothetical protein [Flavobacterium sedimenticola]|uniref:Uncharacterized protein n=1 Tax=Flavobacterium sedimenticola TaxID=3043286 RepID=A0ABT6XPN5_9FLAO|nr:hypothetical protein [Flavobacterium sedimenticola]MDI9257048.1 hypothetical protein [Flavobacterium sedimenticola]